MFLERAIFFNSNFFLPGSTRSKGFLIPQSLLRFSHGLLSSSGYLSPLRNFVNGNFLGIGALDTPPIGPTTIQATFLRDAMLAFAGTVVEWTRVFSVWEAIHGQGQGLHAGFPVRSVLRADKDKKLPHPYRNWAAEAAITESRPERDSSDWSAHEENMWGRTMTIHVADVGSQG